MIVCLRQKKIWPGGAGGKLTGCRGWCGGRCFTTVFLQVFFGIFIHANIDVCLHSCRGEKGADSSFSVHHKLFYLKLKAQFKSIVFFETWVSSTSPNKLAPLRSSSTIYLPPVCSACLLPTHLQLTLSINKGHYRGHYSVRPWCLCTDKTITVTLLSFSVTN